MLAFIGGLFAGIFGIQGSLRRKKSDYILEFDEPQGTTNLKQESTPATVTAKESTNTEAKPAIYETPKAAQAKIYAAKKTKKVESQEPTVLPKPSLTNGKVSQKPEELVLFAPNFLMPKPTTKRRRPGLSMTMFRSMAKDMNLPR